MADIQPFKGIRPRPELAARISSPPYDVMNTKEARAMAAGNPICFLHVTRAEIDYDDSVDAHSPAIYEKGSANLKKLEADGVMARDQTPCFYIYRQIMDGHPQIGVMAGASVAEYETDRIKKHELTRRDKEDDRAMHTDILNANTGPVMITYRAKPAIDDLVKTITARAPTYDFKAPDGISHTLWVVDQAAEVQKLQALFTGVDALYVADGHHRSAAGFRVAQMRRARNPAHTGREPYNHFLAVMFPDNQLQILGYFRAVKDLNGLEPAAFLAKVKERFEVAKAQNAQPGKLHECTMFLDGAWYQLTPKPGTFDPQDPVNSLDVSILQKNLLDPILGIKDPRTDKRIDFIGGIRGTRELEKRCGEDMRVAFALYPVTVGQLMAIADSGSIMPPKSTWFEPKLRDGLVARCLDA